MAGMCDVCRIYTKKVREIKIPQLAEEIRNQHDLARSAIADIREALCHIKNNMSQTMAPFEAQWIPRAIENAEEAPKHPIEKFFE